MNHGMIASPSSEYTADGRPLRDRFLPALLAVCGVLLSLLFAAHAGAAGPLDTVTTTVGNVTRGVTQTTQETTQTVSKTVDTAVSGATGSTQQAVHEVAPVTDAVSRPTESVVEVTGTIDSTTRAATSDAAPAAQSVNTATQPTTQQAAHMAGSLTQAAPPVMQAVAQPVVQTIATTTAPVVQTTAPVTRTVNATVATTTQPVQSVVKPVIRQVTTVAAPVIQAAPVVQTAAPVIEQASAPVAQTAAMAATTLVAPTEPIVAPIILTVAAAVAPIVTSIAPTLQTLQILAPVAAPMTATAPATTAITTIAPALRSIVADTGHQAIVQTPPATRTVDAVDIAPPGGTAPATALPMIARPAVHRATAVAAEVRTVLPTDTFGTPRAVTASSTRSAWIAATRGGVGASASALIQATPSRDQSEAPPGIAPAMPRSPTLPPRLPTDGLATMSATGTSVGHGFSLLLALATTGWAFVLVGRRILPSGLNLPQPTYPPLVSPG
jgi:uncharacterized protein YoxC